MHKPFEDGIQVIMTQQDPNKGWCKEQKKKQQQKNEMPLILCRPIHQTFVFVMLQGIRRFGSI